MELRSPFLLLSCSIWGDEASFVSRRVTGAWCNHAHGRYVFQKKKSSLFRSVVIRRRLHEQFPQKWKKWGLWGSSRFLGWSGGGTLSSSKKTFMAPFSRRDRLERERRREQHLQGMKKWLTQDVLSSALDQKKTYDTLVIIKWVRGLYSFLQQLFPPMHGKKNQSKRKMLISTCRFSFPMGPLEAPEDNTNMRNVWRRKHCQTA